MGTAFKAALVQTTSGRDVGPNAHAMVQSISDAKAMGADVVMFPETAHMMELRGSLLAEKAAFEDDDPGLRLIRDSAREQSVWVLIGSLVLKHETLAGKFVNRSILIDAAGEIVARYDKIHMFDADLGGGEYYRESKNYAPGGSAVIAGTPWGKLGMTVCYDLRFPHLYRGLAQAGAAMLSIPSAFTRPTGRAHWEVLLRARAIECGAFVFAPAQCGEHENGRKTYGHSLIVDPWGEVLADGGEIPGIIVADIDMARVEDARRRMPSLSHDRDYSA